MAALKPFDPSALDSSAKAPHKAFFSTAAGAFCLSGDSGDAIFAWYHEDGKVDAHHHKLAYRGATSLSGDTFHAYAPAEAGGTEHAHEMFLFSEDPLSPHEGHRVFYLAHGHLHLLASDMRCLPLHGGGHSH